MVGESHFLPIYSGMYKQALLKEGSIKAKFGTYSKRHTYIKTIFILLEFKMCNFQIKQGHQKGKF